MHDVRRKGQSTGPELKRLNECIGDEALIDIAEDEKSAYK